MQKENNFYNFKKYDTKSRWMSYWHQIDEVLKLNPNNILEIGVGNQTVTRYLRDLGINVSTLDVDQSLKPDVLGSVLSLPFADNAFEAILCCEVLEHLPFSDFKKGLRELFRVGKRDVVLSLPHFAPPLKLSFKAPFLREISWAVKIPWPITHPQGLEHYWEIGKKDYALSKIKEEIRQYFEITRDFVPFENQYHHFFVLRCKK